MHGSHDTIDGRERRCCGAAFWVYDMELLMGAGRAFIDRCCLRVGV